MIDSASIQRLQGFSKKMIIRQQEDSNNLKHLNSVKRVSY